MLKVFTSQKANYRAVAVYKKLWKPQISLYNILDSRLRLAWLSLVVDSHRIARATAQTCLSMLCKTTKIRLAWACFAKQPRFAFLPLSSPKKVSCAGCQGGPEAGSGFRRGRIGLLRGRPGAQEKPHGLARPAVDHHLQQAHPHEATVGSPALIGRNSDLQFSLDGKQ